ncbi:MAG: DUF1385 domain-containing protein [Candidatus Latescibacterota bacterium]
MGDPARRSQFTEDLPVGGQAVIEGVMMRVPGRIVTAVRAPDGHIVLRSQAHMPLARRVRLLRTPVVRGAVSFVEMLVIGLRALNYSADVALQAERLAAPAAAWRPRVALAVTLVVAAGLGVGLFFFLPLLAAQVLAAPRDALRFNLLAGAVRAGLLLAYLWGISQWPEVRRVFQYHGAEHKSIFAVEAGDPLTVECARAHARLHPRCGTSFMLIVVLLAIVVFSVVDSLFPVAFGHQQSLPERFLTHLAVLPLLGGIGFELLKLSGRKRHHPLARALMGPGLWLQRITTREPDDAQLEVALAALRAAVQEERQDSTQTAAGVG